MAKTMKTIKFGENGEVYHVNEFPVQVSGELTEAGTNIDFGTFEDGLTEVEAALKGVEGGSGDYFFITINGKQSGFITCQGIYTANCIFRIKKVGGLWGVISNISGNFVPYTLRLLNDVDKITSLSIQSYGANTPFGAGHKYALEGR